VALDERWTLAAADLFYRHRHSPYLGKSLRGRVVRTLLRGNTVFLNGQVDPRPLGRLLTPHRLAPRR
jgi:allantoinase